VDQDEPSFPQVRQQDPDDAKRQVEIGGQVGDRDGQAAPAQDEVMLWFEPDRIFRQAADG
jgi:hypothetical protein